MEIVQKLRQLGSTKFGSYIVVCGVFVAFCSITICIMCESIIKGIAKGIRDGCEEISDGWDVVGPALRPAKMQELMLAVINKSKKKEKGDKYGWY